MILPKEKRSAGKNIPIATFLPQIVLALNLKTKIILSCVSRLISYRAVSTFFVGYKKTQSVRVT
jgi:hypothetical protein